jgi:hypothetical protein
MLAYLSALPKALLISVKRQPSIPRMRSGTLARHREQAQTCQANCSKLPLDST